MKDNTYEIFFFLNLGTEGKRVRGRKGGIEGLMERRKGKYWKKQTGKG